MADAEFEEDLFADLYTEDDAQPSTAAAPAEVKTEPVVVNGTSEVKQEETSGVQEAGHEDQGQYNGDEADDDVDFNLGDGNDYNATAPRETHGPGIKEDGKMFIGGLNWETTDESLKDYFSQFGEVLECTVMRDGASGRSRGFGFLTFKDARTVNIVMVKEHYLDGKIIDPKRAIPRDEQERTSKIFVGGVSQEATEQDFKEYFMQFGRVVDATLMIDKDTGRPRGFGFVTFDSEQAVEQCLDRPLEILGKPIEVKKAQPRGNMREEEETSGRNNQRGRFRKADDRLDHGGNNQQSQQQQQGAMAPGGMTPQLMAQYWQRMQQYFQVMQQNMMQGGGRGMPMAAMNPAMMQQVQAMQQMQAMQQQMGGGQGGRSVSPASPGAAMNGMQMNPAMLAQLQQMQQMQQMQMMGAGGAGGGSNAGAGAGGGSGGSQSGGRSGSQQPGYNAYEQQMFEQQKYEQQQMRRAARDQQQYGNGGGYGGGSSGGSGPTSWEGMYDDVPQPNPGPSGGGGGRGGFQGGNRSGSQSSTPQASAAPAGAPTGPKNAGKPGSNYRGGGRGSRGVGYHPYGR